MKTIYFLAFILLSFSCKDSGNVSTTDNYIRVNSNQYQIVVIDGCEYIYGLYTLTHKGDCKQCIERQKELIKNEIKRQNENN